MKKMFYEDEIPTVKKVRGAKYNGTRYNSTSGFIYHKQKATQKSEVFHCKYHKRDRGGCKARIRLELATGIYARQGPHPHNHRPQFDEQAYVEAVANCVGGISSCQAETKEVYNKFCREHPNVRLHYGPALQKQIQRAKQRLQGQPSLSVNEVELLPTTYPNSSEKMSNQLDCPVNNSRQLRQHVGSLLVETPRSSRVLYDQEKLGVAQLPSRRLITGKILNSPRNVEHPANLVAHAFRPVDASREISLGEVKYQENHMTAIPVQCIQETMPDQVRSNPSPSETNKVEDPALSAEQQVTANAVPAPTAVKTRSGREVRAPMWFIIPAWNRRID